MKNRAPSAEANTKSIEKHYLLRGRQACLKGKAAVFEFKGESTSALPFPDE